MFPTPIAQRGDPQIRGGPHLTYTIVEKRWLSEGNPEPCNQKKKDTECEHPKNHNVPLQKIQFNLTEEEIGPERYMAPRAALHSSPKQNEVSTSSGQGSHHQSLSCYMTNAFGSSYFSVLLTYLGIFREKALKSKLNN